VEVENFVDAVGLNVVAEIFVSDTVVRDLDLFESLPLLFWLIISHCFCIRRCFECSIVAWCVPSMISTV
jgi:hypothetical protein